MARKHKMPWHAPPFFGGGDAPSFFVPQETSGSTTPEWVPEGAVAYADFINGHYYAGGTATTAAATIADPSKITAEGLQFNESSAGIPMLGAFAAAFLTANWTVEVTYKTFGIGGAGMLFSVYSPGGVDLVHVGASSQGGVTIVQDWLDDWNDVGRETDPHPGIFDPAIDVPLTVRVTRTDAKLAVQQAPDPVQSDTSFNFPLTTLTTAEFGDSPGPFYNPTALAIRTVAVFPPDP